MPISVSIPPETDVRWKSVVTGEKDPAFSCLATKLLVARLRQKVALNPSEMNAAIGEMRQFFVANVFAEKDLDKF